MRLVLLLIALVIIAGCAPVQADDNPQELPAYMERGVSIGCQLSSGTLVRFTPRRMVGDFIVVNDLEISGDSMPSSALINPDMLAICTYPN